VQLTDRLAGWFVLALLTLAAATFLLWSWLDPAHAVEHAVALLIVTCPCALGLATPLAITVALGRAARRQILIKGGEALERLARPGRMLLDKTGTLTEGRTSLVGWHGDPAVRPLVAVLERHSAHPIARALVAACQPAVAAPEELPVTDVQQTTGGGLRGVVAGQPVIVGSPAFVRSQGVEIPEDVADAERAVVAACQTPVLVAVAGRGVAVAALGDAIRSDAAAALAELQRCGWELQIVSGDHPAVVAAVARQLGIAESAVRGGVTPEEKAALARQAAAQGSVVMVGDGVNDAAALSAATVGIAVHGGAEASLAAADIYLSRPGLAPIVDLIHAARQTLRTIRRALLASLCYNALTAGLAIAGLIGPLVAAILMPISSFTVLAIAYASRTFGDSP
jgi:Cu2+-exporting ATPase